MRILALLLLATLPALATVRTWRSADGTRSFEAQFLANDGSRVTLKRTSDNRVLSFPSDRLHADDLAWLSANAKPAGDGQEESPEGAAFDNLEFGDSRRTVEDKLKKSKFVSTKVNETLFGRTGLNGIYQTRNTIGGLPCFLYFDWNKAGHLREVTLQTQPVGKTEYNTRLRANWHELIKLLSTLHGHPVQEAPYPEAGELEDGLLLGSHIWYTEEGHSVLLCTGQERNDYIVAVRITSERIKPVPVAGNPDPGRRVAPRFEE